MPNTASAKKANRQNIVRRARNAERKDAVRNAVRAVRKLVAAKKMDEARQKLVAAYRTLDKIAKTNVITKNKASRLKSRLAQLIAKSAKASS